MNSKASLLFGILLVSITVGRAVSTEAALSVRQGRTQGTKRHTAMPEVRVPRTVNFR